MESLLVATKLRVPAPRPGLIGRARLIERLEHEAGSRLVLVSAPAGFGKTSLLTQWLEMAAGRGDVVGWLALDESDDRPGSFWPHLVAALGVAVPGFGSAVLPLLESGGPPSEGLLASLINEIDTLSGRLWLVLDDYHVIGDQGIHAGVSYLLEHLPAHACLSITTRADPPLPLARLRARGDLVELRAADLRFTLAEASTYLIDVMGLELRPEDTAVLEARTEGWIAALQLAGLSMQGREDIAGFIAGFTGNDRYVVDYLVEEVLARQPDSVRSFLLRTSILEQLTGPLCDAVTGDGAGKSTLEQLDRSNLFVVPLDDRRQWYRYHRLFADVLRAYLEDEHSDQIPDLHQRASAWYEQHGQRVEAIRHALAGGDFERAAELVEAALPQLRQTRQELQLLAWVKPLPDEVVRRRPVLSVGFAGALLATGQLAGVEDRLDDAERRLGAVQRATAVDAAELRRVPGNIAMFRAGLAQVRGDVPAAVEQAQQALQLAPEDDHVVRAGAAGFLGIALWTGGELGAAHRAWSECVDRLERAGHISDALGATLALGDICTVQGFLSDALAAYEHSLALVPEQSRALVRGTADMCAGMSDVLRERNDLDGARRLLLAGHELGEHAAMPQHPYRWRAAMARLRLAEGDPQEALRLLDDADRVYVSDFFPEVRPRAALRARVLIAMGHLREARNWAREADLSPEDELSYQREFEHISLARLLLAVAGRGEDHKHSRTEAAGLLGRLHEAAESGARTGSLIEILILEAIAAAGGGDRTSALAALEQALTAAEPEGYVRMFVDEGQAMTGLLVEASRRGIASGYVSELLAGGAPPTTRRDQAQRLLEPLSDRELEVLRLLASELSGPDIASHLYVSVNTLRTHTKHIFSKLDVNTRRAAVRRATEIGLL